MKRNERRFPCLDRVRAGGAGLRHHLPQGAAARDHEVLLPAPDGRPGLRMDRGHDRLRQVGSLSNLYFLHFKKVGTHTTIYSDSVTRVFPADDVEEASAGKGRAQSSVPTFKK